LTDDSVPVVGELTSMGARRCAPRAGCLARVGKGTLPQMDIRSGPCCRIKAAVTSASRTNPFRVGIREGDEGCVTENGAEDV
jgi:hypothetical protein